MSLCSAACGKHAHKNPVQNTYYGTTTVYRKHANSQHCFHCQPLRLHAVLISQGTETSCPDYQFSAPQVMFFVAIISSQTWCLQCIRFGVWQHRQDCTPDLTVNIHTTLKQAPYLSSIMTYVSCHTKKSAHVLRYARYVSFYYWGYLTLILRRSRTGTVWFYTSTSNKRAARPKLYTESLTRDLKLMYSRLTLVRISINL